MKKLKNQVIAVSKKKYSLYKNFTNKRKGLYFTFPFYKIMRANWSTVAATGKSKSAVNQSKSATTQSKGAATQSKGAATQSKGAVTQSKGAATQSKGAATKTLPKIYSLSIVKEVEHAVISGEPVSVVKAATGLGKTVFLTRFLASLSMICHVLMPFRISVKEMWSYVSSLDPEIQYGYRMRGQTEGNKDDACTMFTVGYWVEWFIGYMKQGNINKPMVIVVDEAHDSSWQTDLALKMLLWAQRTMKLPIQIIVSSATLDVTESIKDCNPKIFSVDDNKANVEMVFLKESISSIEKGKMSDDLKSQIMSHLISIARNTEVGDILVLLPGENEIEELRADTEKNPLFNDFAMHDIFSGISREDQDAAVQPDPEGKRKIIFGTNAVENAITIKGLTHIVDSGVRKVNVIDRSGVSQLVLEPASQANIKQASGRVGREGSRGTAYIMMSDLQFNLLKPFSANEVTRNPLYHQIMKLLSNNLPFYEILHGISKHRIDDDLYELFKVGAISKEGNVLKVTRIGEIIAALPLSLRAGSFLAKAVLSLDPSYHYMVCVVASWIDLNGSLFLNPRKKPREDSAAFDARKDEAKMKQERFHGTDCLTTMLDVWLSCDEANDTISKWCYKNGIFDRSIKELFNNVTHCVDSLKKVGITVEKYDLKKEHIPSIVPAIVHFLKETFADRVLTCGYDGNYRSANTNAKYIKDNATDFYQPPKSVIALNLRAHSGGRIIFMSKIVSLDSTTQCVVESDDDSY